MLVVQTTYRIVYNGLYRLVAWPHSLAFYPASSKNDRKAKKGGDSRSTGYSHSASQSGAGQSGAGYSGYSGAGVSGAGISGAYSD